MMTWAAVIVGAASFVGAAGAAVAECKLESAKYSNEYRFDEITQLSLAWTITKSDYDTATMDITGEAVLYGVPVGGSYGDFRENIKREAQTLGLENFEKRAVAYATSGLDAVGLDAYRDCLLHEGGMEVSAKVIGSESYTISLIYVSRPTDAKDLTWKLSDGTNIKDADKARLGEEIGRIQNSAVQKEFSFQPSDLAKEVTITISLGDAYSKSLLLPPINIPSPIVIVDKPDPNRWLHHASPRITDKNSLAFAVDDVGQWINNSCKPNSFNEIEGFVSQNGAAEPFFVHIYCYRGGGKLGPVELKWVNWDSKAAIDAIKAEAGEKNRFSLLGLRLGQRGHSLFIVAPKT